MPLLRLFWSKVFIWHRVSLIVFVCHIDALSTTYVQDPCQNSRGEGRGKGKFFGGGINFRSGKVIGTGFTI